MSVLRVNLVANVAGKLILSLLTFIFIPFYLKFLGAEAYGLIGFFATFQAIFLIFDGGLGAAYTREVARSDVLVGNLRGKNLLDLSVTLERVSIILAVAVLIISTGLSGVIAESWLSATALSSASVENSLILMGMAIALQLPFLIYQGGLSGLQAHQQLNVMLVSMLAVRGVGSILLLKFVSPTIEVFFLWQVLVSMTQLFIARYLLFRLIGRKAQEKKRGQFQLRVIRHLWRFSIGVFGTTVTGIALMQADKIILSKMLSLEEFAYYSMAGLLASVPLMISIPINATVYPRLSQLASIDDNEGLVQLYHKSCQLIAAVAVPIGLTLAMFPELALYLWIGSRDVAQVSSGALTFLSIGYTLMTLLLVPYSLQLAFSWTQLGLLLNMLSVVIIIPFTVVLIDYFGIMGAAAVVMLVYVMQIVLMIHFMHKRLIPEEKWTWYFSDVIKPVAVVSVVLGVSKLVLSGYPLGLNLAVMVFLAWLFSFALAIACLPMVRSRVLAIMNRLGVSIKRACISVAKKGGN